MAARSDAWFRRVGTVSLTTSGGNQVQGFGAVLPWREEPTPYRVWVSEIMLQQTRVEAVRGYYARFLEALPTVADLAKAPDDGLGKLWEGLGY